MSTTAEIFADYLGLTPEGAPWAYDRLCPICDRDICAGDGRYNFECLAGHQFDAPKHILTATSPLAEKPTPGWLEVLVCAKRFAWLDPCGGREFYAVAAHDTENHRSGMDAHPTRAVALALLAAAPDLRARCEQASDASEVL